jgi:8-oxo-dGTP pyrophosphatase MutT (NUDIX family)
MDPRAAEATKATRRGLPREGTGRVSLHASAVAMLTAWRAPDTDQEALRRDFLGHLARHPDGVWRTCRPAHLTASAIVVDPTGTLTLLVLHGRIGLWVQPGGHCEPGDTSIAGVAAREVSEETGLLDVAVSLMPLLLSRHRAPCGAESHLDVQYVAVAPADATPVASAESHDVRWFPVADLPRDLASGVASGVASAVAALHRGLPDLAEAGAAFPARTA